MTNCLLVPFIFFYRCVFWSCNCLCKNRTRSHINIENQLKELSHASGGWWRDKNRQTIDTRDTFYIFLFQKIHNKIDTTKLRTFVNTLSLCMTNDGKVPSAFEYSWTNYRIPIYQHNNKNVIDANMFFIILVWWLRECDESTLKHYYLHAQRAWAWLDISFINETVHESIGASWNTAQKHKGTVLLTNVLNIRCVRCMELISMAQRDEPRMKKFGKIYDRCVSTWVPEIYKTQEMLPKILAIFWNIVPSNFLQSFNQSILTPFVPCRTEGPISQQTTMDSNFYGIADQYDTVVWPWITMLWINILFYRKRKKQLKQWLDKTVDFVYLNTVFDMYDKHTLKPFGRAFLKSQPEHALSLQAKMLLDNIMYNEQPDNEQPV